MVFGIVSAIPSNVNAKSCEIFLLDFSPLFICSRFLFTIEIASGVGKVSARTHVRKPVHKQRGAQRKSHWRRRRFFSYFKSTEKTSRRLLPIFRNPSSHYPNATKRHIVVLIPGRECLRGREPRPCFEFERVDAFVGRLRQTACWNDKKEQKKCQDHKLCSSRRVHFQLTSQTNARDCIKKCNGKSLKICIDEYEPLAAPSYY